MLYTMSTQMFKYEHGLTAAQQRAEDVRAGEVAAALTGLGSQLGRVFRPRQRVRSARLAADATTVPVQVLSSAR